MWSGPGATAGTEPTGWTIGISAGRVTGARPRSARVPKWLNPADRAAGRRPGRDTGASADVEQAERSQRADATESEWPKRNGAAGVTPLHYTNGDSRNALLIRASMQDNESTTTEC